MDDPKGFFGQKVHLKIGRNLLGIRYLKEPKELFPAGYNGFRDDKQRR